MEVLWDNKKLRRIGKNRQIRRPAVDLGTSVGLFMRKVVIPRQKRMSKLARAWSELLPVEMQEHSCLEKFTRGRLLVLVDTAGHLAELNMIVREGLLDDIRQLCPTVPISGIKLTRGKWYESDEEGNRIPEF